MIRFGTFEVNLRSGTLHRSGFNVRLPEQSFQVLIKLLERPGEVVTRDEIRHLLWRDDTFVDFDNSINAAVNRLREALGDSAANPRFIATLARRGYSFIAPVHAPNSSAPSVTTDELPGGKASSSSNTYTLQRKRLGSGALLVALILIVLGVFLRTSAVSRPKVTRITPVTTAGRIDVWGGLVSDGSRLFFLERAGDHWNLMQVSVKGGEPQPFPAVPRNTRILDIAPDRSEFLIASFTMRNLEMPLWTMTVVGGPPRRVGSIVARDAAWYPDGRRIVFSRGTDIFSVDRYGSDERRIVTTSGAASRFAWSPDGRRLRFTMTTDGLTSTIWEVSSDGGNLHRLPTIQGRDVTSCCGRWTADGRYFIFSAAASGAAGALWAIAPNRGWWRRGFEPVQLTTGPTPFTEPVITGDATRLFVLGDTAQSESLQYDLASRHLVSFPGKLVALESSFTRDGQWIAYLDHSHTIWRRRADGSEQLQLTYPPLEAFEPRFSPDGKRIAFSAKSGGRWTVYVVSVDGGRPEAIPTRSGDRICSDWAPDGNSLVLWSQDDIPAGGPPKTMLWTLDLSSHSESLIPGSEGLNLGRWSSDGSYLAAKTDGEDSKLMVFDRRTKHWRELIRGKGLGYLAWSRDPRYVYIQERLAPGQPIYRVQIADRRRELIASFEEQLGSGFVRLTFTGLTWDGVPMLWATRALGDVYAVDLDGR